MTEHSEATEGEWGVARPLTHEALKEAFDQIANLPEPCANGHVVSPTSYRRGGWAICANCRRAVFCGGD